MCTESVLRSTLWLLGGDGAEGLWGAWMWVEGGEGDKEPRRVLCALELVVGWGGPRKEQVLGRLSLH